MRNIRWFSAAACLLCSNVATARAQDIVPVQHAVSIERIDRDGAGTMQRMRPLGADEIRDALLRRADLVRPGTRKLLSVELRRGVAVLRGRLDNLLVRDRVVEEARLTSGVRAVVDMLELDVPRRTDAVLASEAQLALLTDPLLAALAVDATVEEGIVTLRGQVRSNHDRRLANDAVKAVPGIRAVVDAIETTYAADLTRPDPLIEADIARRLRADPFVVSKDVHVEVRDFRVTVKGRCSSAIEKGRIRKLVWVSGVEDVTTDELTIDGTLRDPMRREADITAVPDRTLELAVQDALIADERVGAPIPQIEVRRGMVVLSGVVHSLRARRAAELDARNTVGVFGVTNLVEPQPDPGLSDQLLASRVREALAATVLKSRRIYIEAWRGRVLLLGEVAGELERRLAEDRVGSLHGVVAIENALLTRRAKPATPSDGNLHAAIVREMFMSPWIDAGAVDLNVRNSTATISGTVESAAARTAAEECARKAGARRVINQLVITPQTVHALR